jgi:hypothetical protein
MPTAAQTRHLIIGIAKRRQRAGSGSSLDFLKGRTAKLRFPDLSATLSGIPWAATGAAAARMYMPERMTNDLDILVRKSDAEIIRRRLEQAQTTFKGELSIGGASWTLPDGFPLDVIEGEEEWVDAALQEADGNRDPHGMPVLTLPYQVLMKFRASRVQDIADISRMLGQATDLQVAETRTLFNRLLPKDLDDLESLIELGRLELS